MGIGLPVGAHQSVVAEVLVVDVIRVEVSAVSIDGFALVIGPPQGLVHKVPDKAALELGILAGKVPILLESALGVAHRMGVFAQNQGPRLAIVKAVLLHPFVVHIHQRGDVSLSLRIGVSPFILNRARGVLRLHQVVSRREIGTIAGLVAQRPDDDTGVIAGALDVPEIALQVGQGIVFPDCQGLFLVSHSVALQIRLAEHIDSILIAQLVPQIGIGIVAGSYRIDIELLHKRDVLNHTLPGDYIASVGVQFVAVGTLDKHRLPVDQKLRIDNLNLSESHFEGYGFRAARRIQSVEIRTLGRPFFHFSGFEHNFSSRAALRGQLPAFGIPQAQVHIDLALGLQSHLKLGCPVILVKIGFDIDVFDSVLLTGIQVAVSSHTAKAEEILVLKV